MAAVTANTAPTSTKPAAALVPQVGGQTQTHQQPSAAANIGAPQVVGTSIGPGAHVRRNQLQTISPAMQYRSTTHNRVGSAMTRRLSPTALVQLSPRSFGIRSAVIGSAATARTTTTAAGLQSQMNAAGGGASTAGNEPSAILKENTTTTTSTAMPAGTTAPPSTTTTSSGLLHTKSTKHLYGGNQLGLPPSARFRSMSPTGLLRAGLGPTNTSNFTFQPTALSKPTTTAGTTTTDHAQIKAATVARIANAARPPSGTSSGAAPATATTSGAGVANAAGTGGIKTGNKSTVSSTAGTPMGETVNNPGVLTTATSTTTEQLRQLIGAPPSSSSATRLLKDGSLERRNFQFKTQAMLQGGATTSSKAANHSRRQSFSVASVEHWKQQGTAGVASTKKLTPTEQLQGGAAAGVPLVPAGSTASSTSGNKGGAVEQQDKTSEQHQTPAATSRNSSRASALIAAAANATAKFFSPQSRAGFNIARASAASATGSGTIAAAGKITAGETSTSGTATGGTSTRAASSSSSSSTAAAGEQGDNSTKSQPAHSVDALVAQAVQKVDSRVGSKTGSGSAGVSPQHANSARTSSGQLLRGAAITNSGLFGKNTSSASSLLQFHSPTGPTGPDNISTGGPLLQAGTSAGAPTRGRQPFGIRNQSPRGGIGKFSVSPEKFVSLSPFKHGFLGFGVSPRGPQSRTSAAGSPGMDGKNLGSAGAAVVAAAVAGSGSGSASSSSSATGAPQNTTPATTGVKNSTGAAPAGGPAVGNPIPPLHPSSLTSPADSALPQIALESKFAATQNLPRGGNHPQEPQSARLPGAPVVTQHSSRSGHPVVKPGGASAQYRTSSHSATGNPSGSSFMQKQQSSATLGGAAHRAIGTSRGPSQPIVGTRRSPIQQARILGAQPARGPSPIASIQLKGLGFGLRSNSPGVAWTTGSGAKPHLQASENKALYSSRQNLLQQIDIEATSVEILRGGGSSGNSAGPAAPGDHGTTKTAAPAASIMAATPVGDQAVGQNKYQTPDGKGLMSNSMASTPAEQSCPPSAMVVEKLQGMVEAVSDCSQKSTPAMQRGVIAPVNVAASEVVVNVEQPTSSSSATSAGVVQRPQETSREAAAQKSSSGSCNSESEQEASSTTKGGPNSTGFLQQFPPALPLPPSGGPQPSADGLSSASGSKPSTSRSTVAGVEGGNNSATGGVSAGTTSMSSATTRMASSSRQQLLSRPQLTKRSLNKAPSASKIKAQVDAVGGFRLSPESMQRGIVVQPQSRLVDARGGPPLLDTSKSSSGFKTTTGIKPLAQPQIGLVPQSSPQHKPTSTPPPTGHKYSVRAGVVVAGHWAASRIQRWWRLLVFHSRFYSHGRNVLKWIGSLEWLMKQNMLYGTEIAEQEDFDYWDRAFHSSALDSEVDPWGNKRLREHLNKMWYGSEQGPAVTAGQQQQVVQVVTSQQQDSIAQQHDLQQYNDHAYLPNATGQQQAVTQQEVLPAGQQYFYPSGGPVAGAVPVGQQSVLQLEQQQYAPQYQQVVNQDQIPCQ
ncbi:unnamed protein product [Amoebophrya sp. A120]|nr:unnamed protein product [Amoebophrya sp. A120]|eukprot:GSA120T00000537001.1